MIVLRTIISPYAVSQWYKPALDMARAGAYLANYARSGALAGTILFALLTLMELNRVYRASTDVITDSIASPLMMNVSRLCAVMIVALLAAAITTACYLPFTMHQLGNVFSLRDYLASYGILKLPGMWMGCLLAAALYQITRRVDASFIVFAAYVLFSMSDFAMDSFLMRWINPIVPMFSDDFSNAQPLIMAAYNRPVYLLAFGGLWLLSWL